MNAPGTQADAMLARCRRLLSDHRTRVKKDGAALNYSLHNVRQLLADNTLCTYCRAPVAWDATLDHRKPIGRGGWHALNNLAVCCSRCNALRADSPTSSSS